MAVCNANRVGSQCQHPNVELERLRSPVSCEDDTLRRLEGARCR